MKRTRLVELIVCVMLLTGVAGAGTMTVTNTLDYNDNGGWEGPWFIPPDVTLDHSPYYRHMNEDWGWTHSVVGKVPDDARGIDSATLEIYAWDVDANDVESPEIDIIYANGVELGNLLDTDGRKWQSTVFDLPSSVLQDLWTDGEVYVYMDIDTIRDFIGHRVTLQYATLTVEYLVSGSGKPTRLSVHQFWSSVLNTYFYTASDAEKKGVESKYPDVWRYEGIAYSVLTNDTEPNSAPVYRFWSPTLLEHFYTMSEEEKEALVKDYADVWMYEGIAWYAFPAGEQPEDAVPVYRLGSDDFVHHFYTISEEEKDARLKDYADVWTYNDIAWYAYE